MKKIAAEVIYQMRGDGIIDFKEIDPNTLSKMYSEDGSFVWVQYSNDPERKRIFTTNQIVTNF